MITPPTETFYAIRITGEAADLITNKLSPSTTSDIFEAVLISDDYESDISAYNQMESTVKELQSHLDQTDIKIDVKFNPLYYPATPEEIEGILESDGKSDSFRFVGMDGNPFTMTSTNISCNDELIITAQMACHQFELPALNEILDAQKDLKLQ